MPATHLGPLVAPHRGRTRLTLVDDAAAVRTADHSAQDSGQPPDRLPRATWQHGVLMGITAAIGAWFAIDLVHAIGNPEVISGHLRGALVAAIVALTVTMSNWRTYRRIERLHAKNRAINSWFEARAKVIDQRDAAIHQHLNAVTEDVTLIGRAMADELAQTRHIVVELRQDFVQIAEAVGYSNGSIRRVRQEIASIGGGQAAVAEVVEHLAHMVRQLVERQQRAMSESQPGGDDVRQAYQRGEQEAEDSNVVALPSGAVYELGKKRGRLEAKQERDTGGDFSTS